MAAARVPAEGLEEGQGLLLGLLGPAARLDWAEADERGQSETGGEAEGHRRTPLAFSLGSPVLDGKFFKAWIRSYFLGCQY